MVVLILISHIEHGNKLLEMLKNCGVLRTLFIHGSLPKEQRNKYIDQIHNNEIDVVIGSSILDEGFDASNFNVVILAAGGKSSIKLTQRVGRVLRPNGNKKALIIDFIDTPKYLKDHYEKRHEILEQDFKVILHDELRN